MDVHRQGTPAYVISAATRAPADSAASSIPSRTASVDAATAARCRASSRSARRCSAVSSIENRAGSDGVTGPSRSHCCDCSPTSSRTSTAGARRSRWCPSRRSWRRSTLTPAASSDGYHRAVSSRTQRGASTSRALTPAGRPPAPHAPGHRPPPARARPAGARGETRVMGTPDTRGPASTAWRSGAMERREAPGQPGWVRVRRATCPVRRPRSGCWPREAALQQVRADQVHERQRPAQVRLGVGQHFHILQLDETLHRGAGGRSYAEVLVPVAQGGSRERVDKLGEFATVCLAGRRPVRVQHRHRPIRRGVGQVVQHADDRRASIPADTSNSGSSPSSRTRSPKATRRAARRPRTRCGAGSSTPHLRGSRCLPR